MIIKIKNDNVNGWYILRDEGKHNDECSYLHKNGTWHSWCGKENFHDTYIEARDLLDTLTEEERVRKVGDDPDEPDYTATNEFPTQEEIDTASYYEEIDEYLNDTLFDCEEERKAIQEEDGADLELEFEGARTVTITIQIN